MNKTTECPSCGCKYRVPLEFKGREISCKKCGTQFQLNLPDENNQNSTGKVAQSLESDVEEISQDDSYLLIGKLAVKYKFASVEQIKEALAFKAQKQQAGQKLLLGKILVAQGIITQSQFDFLHSLQKMMEARETDSKLGMVIVKNDFATQEEVDQALQEQKKVFIDTKAVKSIGDILFESGVITEEEHDVVLAVQKRLKDTADAKRKPAIHDAVEQTAIDDLFELSVSEDQLHAFILPKTEVTEALTSADVKKFLERNKIIHGIVDDTLIEEYLRDKNSHKEPWEIAAGELANPGKDAEIKYYLETDPLKIEKVKAGGVVDFEDKAAISQVKKDDLLVEKTPPVAGTPGKDVYGNLTDAPKFKDIKLRCGKGATLSEDGTKIIANTDGVPKISVHGKVYVLPQHEIRGDVGKNTGHVNFDGEINVTESIRSGYRVQGHSLAVDTILGAEVEMIGDIIVSGGIIKAAIKTDGHVRARFVRGADIKAYGDVIVEKGIRDSKIETSGACIVKEGIILASKITAKKGIWAGQIGSEVSRPCGLTVGVDVRAKNEIDKIIPLIPSRKQDLAKLKSYEQELTQKSNQIESKIGELAQLQDRDMINRKKIQNALDQLKEDADPIKLQNTETALKEMDTESEKMEKKMEKLFDLQDKISEKIANVNQEIEIAEVEVQKLENRIAEITEWSSNGDGIPEVRVKGAIFPETKIDAEKSALTLKQSQKNVLIKEHKIQQRGKMPKWQMKISDLKI
ncbi:MAG: flagellar assembly protein A [Candidatus Desulfatibia sp.]|uniref:flagellar assembly protein A n=1 Tax=Candidatus Desulfatibia sp. TaxID=3101189 RepID=UPI002F2B9E57